MALPTTTDENEDLFNFDNEPQAASASSAAPKKAAVVNETPSVAPTQLPLAHPVVEHVTQVRAALPAPVVERSASAPALAPIQSKRAANVPTRALLVVAVLVNVALVGIVWRSMSGMNAALQSVGERVALASNASSDDAKHSTAWPELDLSPPSAEGETALKTAAQEIARGEYERARARLYSLLSVIDRFDAPQRPNLAARAQVLAADAYREQADALERTAIDSEPKGEFISEPKGDFLDEPREHKR